jgi:pseudouridine kinase
MPASPPFVCVGAAHWDIIGRTAEPLPPGADVPGRIVRRPGGVALNVALALAALHRPVSLLAAVGTDAAGADLTRHLAGAGIDAAHLHRHDGPTDAYLAIEGPHGEIHAAVADCAGLEVAGPALLAPIRDRRVTGPTIADGNLPLPVLDELLVRPSALVVASPGKAAALRWLLGPRAPALYLNRREAEQICGAAFPDSRAAAAALLNHGAAEAIVTDGAAPATAAVPGATVTLPPPPVIAVGLTGAGDAFVAAHIVARADGLDLEAALRAALAAAARHITCEVP